MKVITKLSALLLAVCCMLAMSTIVFGLVDMLPFRDVSTGSWYYYSVRYVYDRGLMEGVAHYSFAPEEKMSRAMAVTVLYRMFSGDDAGKLENPFVDVAEDSWYADAVKWAASTDIVNGRGNGKFDPEADVTRAELCTMVVRFMSLVRLAFPESEGKSMIDFIDVYDIPAYAGDAMQRMYDADVIKGRSGKMIAPNDTATRAETAAIIERVMEKCEIRAPGLLESRYGLTVTANVGEDRMPTFDDVGLRHHLTVTVRTNEKLEESLDVKVSVVVTGNTITESFNLERSRTSDGEISFRVSEDDRYILAMMDLQEDEIVPLAVEVTIDNVSEYVMLYPRMSITW